MEKLFRYILFFVKKELLRNFIKEKGIEVQKSDFDSKVIFMNPKLTISNENIRNSPYVITPEKLTRYLDKQKGTKSHERFFSSIINLLLEHEVASQLIDGLFSRVGGKDFSSILNIIDELATWDKVNLYGSKILIGDIKRSKVNIYKKPY